MARICKGKADFRLLKNGKEESEEYRMSKGITLDEQIEATYNVNKAPEGKNPFKPKQTSGGIGMAENEAITQLKIQRTFTNGANAKVQAIDMAIQALEENQQYHAYKEIFENNFSKEALKILSDKVEFEKWIERGKWIAKRCDEINREVQQYHAIGTVEELQALKEKVEPKKPITYQKTNRADCPVCGKTVRGIDKPFGDWCANCGQKLDWEE